MACRIPGCTTKYWNKNNKLQMFTADGKQALAKWQEILKIQYGMEDFIAGDRVCALHFPESAIERTRKVYLKGGVCEEVALKKPKLCYGSIPTIFPTNDTPKQKDSYAVKIEDPEVLKKQRQLFEKSKQNKEISRKRKHKAESTTSDNEANQPKVTFIKKFKVLENGKHQNYCMLQIDEE